MKKLLQTVKKKLLSKARAFCRIGDYVVGDQLAEMLKNENCREIVAAIVDGDDLSNAFMKAGELNHVILIEAFLDRGINIDVKDRYGYTALIAATESGNEQSVELLLRNHTSIDIQTNYGWTALMNASSSGKKRNCSIAA